jgi:hypothetical protein
LLIIFVVIESKLLIIFVVIKSKFIIIFVVIEFMFGIFLNLMLTIIFFRSNNKSVRREVWNC